MSQEMRYNPECGEQAFYYFDDITVKIALDASDVSPVRVALRGRRSVA